VLLCAERLHLWHLCSAKTCGKRHAVALGVTLLAVSHPLLPDAYFRSFSVTANLQYALVHPLHCPGKLVMCGR